MFGSFGARAWSSVSRPHALSPRLVPSPTDSCVRSTDVSAGTPGGSLRADETDFLLPLPSDASPSLVPLPWPETQHSAG